MTCEVPVPAPVPELTLADEADGALPVPGLLELELAPGLFTPELFASELGAALFAAGNAASFPPSGVEEGVGEGAGPARGVAAGATVAMAVGSDEGAGVGVVEVLGAGVGDEDGDSVGLGVTSGAGDSSGVGLGEGVAAAHVDGVTVFVSKVTAPLRARRRPPTIASVSALIDVSARMFPLKVEFVPKVAELPTCQNTLQLRA